MAKKTVIPAGFELVDSPLVIDTDTVGNLPGKRLYCTRAQMGAIQARLGLNKGELCDSEQEEAEEEPEKGIGNVGHLKL